MELEYQLEDLILLLDKGMVYMSPSIKDDCSNHPMCLELGLLLESSSGNGAISLAKVRATLGEHPNIR